jgi:flagellar hook protein FlgE
VGTDLAIQGTGFFVVRDGGETFFTRAGAFGTDLDGRLVNPSNGMRVQGWMAGDGGALDVSRDVEDLIIPVGSKDPARATTEVQFACNLDKRTQPGSAWSTSVKIYDSFGNEHILEVRFARDDTDADGDGVLDNPNLWNAEVSVDPAVDPVTGEMTNPLGTAAGLGEDPPAADGPNVFQVQFSNTGVLLSVNGEAPAEGQPLLMNVAYTVPDTDPDAEGAAVRQLFGLNLGTVGGYVNSLTQFAESSSSKAVSQDGYTMGYLDNFKIDSTGIITGVYSNGTSRVLGQIALASFTNQGGLEKNGDNTYVASNNSGVANIGPSGIAGKGKIIAGTLEMSNVDMAEQFTDMIVTQRGFQANSRTIQTADQLLQELLTLKR